MANQTKTTLGGVFKFDFKLPVTYNFNIDLKKEGVDFKENWAIQKNNWTFGSLFTWGVSNNYLLHTDFIASHTCEKTEASLRVDGIKHKGIAQWKLGFLWHLNKKWSLGAAWNSGKGGCPVTGTQHVGIDWHPCSHLNGRLTYDRTTFGVLAHIGKLGDPNVSASLCGECDVHGRTAEGKSNPHRFGIKITKV